MVSVVGALIFSAVHFCHAGDFCANLPFHPGSSCVGDYECQSYGGGVDPNCGSGSTVQPENTGVEVQLNDGTKMITVDGGIDGFDSAGCDLSEPSGTLYQTTLCNKTRSYSNVLNANGTIRTQYGRDANTLGVSIPPGSQAANEIIGNLQAYGWAAPNQTYAMPSSTGTLHSGAATWGLIKCLNNYCPDSPTIESENLQEPSGTVVDTSTGVAVGQALKYSSWQQAEAEVEYGVVSVGNLGPTNYTQNITVAKTNFSAAIPMLTADFYPAGSGGCSWAGDCWVFQAANPWFMNQGMNGGLPAVYETTGVPYLLYNYTQGQEVVDWNSLYMTNLTLANVNGHTFAGGTFYAWQPQDLGSAVFGQAPNGCYRSIFGFINGFATSYAPTMQQVFFSNGAVDFQKFAKVMGQGVVPTAPSGACAGQILKPATQLAQASSPSTVDPRGVYPAEMQARLREQNAQSKVNMGDFDEMAAEAGLSPDIRVHDSGIGLCKDGKSLCWIIGVSQFNKPTSAYPNEVAGLVKAAQRRMKAAGAPVIGVEVQPATIIHR